MKLLLDTQIFIWIDSDAKNLSDRARNAILDPSNELFLSIVSIWEMQINYQIGKLQLRMTLSEIVDEQLMNGLQLLDIKPAHIYALDELPLHHRDPIDRLLLAQARLEDMSLVSSDSRFEDYDVDLIW